MGWEAMDYFKSGQTGHNPMVVNMGGISPEENLLNAISRKKLLGMLKSPRWGHREGKAYNRAYWKGWFQACEENK